MNVLILDNKIYIDTNKSKLAEKLCAAKKKNPHVKIKQFAMSQMDFKSSFGDIKTLRSHIEKLMILDKI